MVTRVINVFVPKMTIPMVTIVNQLLSILSYADMKHDCIALNKKMNCGVFHCFSVTLDGFIGFEVLLRFRLKSKPCLTMVAHCSLH